MATDNTQYLRFSANSMKSLITRKLSEDSRFTDQVYEGSNLAILIDIVSYMYQCLIYQLNSAASESMFSDTQIYKNIVRLVKFVDYNPKGCNPSTINSYISTNENLHGYVLPRYSMVDTGLVDVNGKKICFSTQRNTNNNSYNDILQSNSSQPVTLYNGQWKLYSTIFTASGIENETFILDGLKSDADAHQFIAHNFIDIYVRHYTDGDEYEWQRDWEVDVNGIFCGYSTDSQYGLFNNRSAFKSLYPGTYPVYNITLNEDKTYELKFGNGVVGKKLSPGDKIYVFYLDTNGADGKIDMTTIDQSSLKFEHSAAMFGMSQTMYEELFSLNSSQSKILPGSNVNYSLSFKTQTSTTPSLEENVESIRKNAPLNFATGNRLVTRTDYEYYIRNSNVSNMIGEDIVDVHCMNNWEYLASFYKWLYELGSHGRLVEYADYLKNGKVGKPSRYLEKNNFIRYDYFYADAADANNIYIWLKTPSDNFDVATTTSNLNQQLYPIKNMTAEIVACKAINVNFEICAAPIEYVLKNYLNDDFTNNSTFDEQCESYIEVTLNDNAIYVPSSLAVDIQNIILDGFSVNSCTFGQTVNVKEILNRIYALNGVQKVRTVFRHIDQTTGEEVSRSYDGLSFASWSETHGLIQYGDDLNITNSIRQLEDFQFPVFVGKNLLIDRIKIIKKSLSNVNTIKF